jgi:hypothetical protein
VVDRLGGVGRIHQFGQRPDGKSGDRECLAAAAIDLSGQPVEP